MITSHEGQHERNAQRNTGVRSDTNLLAATMRRLSARARLSRLAADAWRGIGAAARTAAPNYVGEATPVCMNGGPATINFECGQADFNCANVFEGGFNCAQTFNCSDGSLFVCVGGGNYDCGGGANGAAFECTDDVYQCYYFNCTTSDIGFACSQDLDYLCDNFYSCMDGFDCTSGHVFLCSNSNFCSTDFGCSAGGTNCSDMYPYSPANNDGTAGDFLCGAGVSPPLAPLFSCPTEFGCTGADDFDCNAQARFFCGSSAEGGQGDFSCSTCDSFTCDNVYNCYGSYTGCGSMPTDEYTYQPPS